MRVTPHLAACVLLLTCLALNGTVTLTPQAIALPAGATGPLFVDLEGNGRVNMLVIDQVRKTVLNYRQGPDGFAASPDQSIPLPPQTAWVATCDVDEHPGLELLFSTADGIYYSRQNAGLFETERHTLVAAAQDFSNFDLPTLVSLTNRDLIPVVSAGHTFFVNTNNVAWLVDHGSFREERWSLGQTTATHFGLVQRFVARPEPPADEPENDGIRKLQDELQKSSALGYSRTTRMDVNGDGRTDVILWHVLGQNLTEFRTDVYIFLRGADQKLPEQPTQILHCRGWPVPTGNTSEPAPFVDLRKDGHCELVLLEMKTTLTSISSAWDALLSHGLDLAVTIRGFHEGAVSRAPDAAVPVTGILAASLDEWPVFILGDFNGDGRPDLVFRRTETRWNIFCSTADDRWFSPEPAFTFEAPAQGYIEIKDLNGDGLSDVIWHNPDHSLLIFMSPSPSAKGHTP